MEVAVLHMSPKRGQAFTIKNVISYNSAIEEAAPDEAIQLYIDACTILEDDDKEQMAFDLYGAATSLYIKIEK